MQDALAEERRIQRDILKHHRAISAAAVALGVSPTMISRYLTGQVESATVREKLCIFVAGIAAHRGY